MKNYKFDEQLPDVKQLPPAPAEFTEREVAKDQLYRWTDWVQIDPVQREKMIAHVLHKNMREAYSSQEIRRKSNPKKKGEDPMSPILNAFGFGKFGKKV